MKLLRFLPAVAFAVLTAIALAPTMAPRVARAQVAYPPVVAALTAACTSDPCGGPLSTSVATIAVPGGTSTCGGDVYGTFEATGVYEVNSIANNAVIADWSSVYVAPTTWVPNTGFSTATNRAFAVHFATPLRNTSYFRVRLTSYTAGTVNVYLTCSGDAGVIQTLPAQSSPTSSPTP